MAGLIFGESKRSRTPSCDFSMRTSLAHVRHLAVPGRGEPDRPPWRRSGGRRAGRGGTGVCVCVCVRVCVPRGVGRGGGGGGGQPAELTVVSTCRWSFLNSFDSW